MTAAAIPKNHAMPMAMIHRGLRRSFSTAGGDSSLAAGGASVTETETAVAAGGSAGLTLGCAISLSCVIQELSVLAESCASVSRRAGVYFRCSTRGTRRCVRSVQDFDLRFED